MKLVFKKDIEELEFKIINKVFEKLGVSYGWFGLQIKFDKEGPVQTAIKELQNLKKRVVEIEEALGKTVIREKIEFKNIKKSKNDA